MLNKTLSKYEKLNLLKAIGEKLETKSEELIASRRNGIRNSRWGWGEKNASQGR